MTTGYGIYLYRAGNIVRLSAGQPTLQLLLTNLQSATPHNTQLAGIVLTSQ